MKPKRLISLLVAVCMMITMLPLSAVTAFAADTSTDPEDSYKGYKYAYTVNNGNATITKFLGPVDPTNNGPYYIEIPSELGGYPVTGLGDYSFAVNADPDRHYPGNPLCRNIHSVTIPQNVKSIGYKAFYECDGLESLTIKDAATSIGSWAFAECPLTTTLELGENITTIGDYAFRSCSSLTNVTIPQSVTSIGDGAFAFCSKMGSLTIKDATTSIGEYAFGYCAKLKTLKLGENITTIGNDAFWYCCALTNVTIPQSVTSIGTNAFTECDSLTTLSLGKNIETIGQYAFRECQNLANVTIPEKVKEIKSDTFIKCYHLKSITLPAGLTSFEDSLEDCPGGCVIYYKNYKTAADALRKNNPVLDNAIQRGRKFLYLCKVTFDANGGSLTDKGGNLTDHAVVSVYKTEKINENDLAAIPNPTRAGYKFTGWYTADNQPLNVNEIITKDITEDINFYAHWTPVYHPLTVTGGTVTVKYDGNDVTSKLNSKTDAATGQKTYSVPEGAKVTVTLDKTAVPNGKVFDGWSTGEFSLPQDQNCKAETITFPMSSDANVSATYRDAATDHTPNTAVCHPLTVTGGIVTVKNGDKDVTNTLTVTTDETTGKKTYSVPDGATVTVTLDKTLIPEGMVFDIWSTGKFSLPTGQNCKAETITFPMSSGVNVSAKYRDAAADHTPDTAVCHPLTVTGGIVTVKNGDKDVTNTLTVTTDETTGKKTYSVPDGATVTVTLDKTLIPEGMVFDIWSTGKFSLPLGQDYKAESITFTMNTRSSDADIAAQYRDATIEDDGSNVLGTAAIIGTAAVGGAVLGYQAYSLGTEFAGKLMALPYFPSNRSALAMMLWEDAGKPMPESELLYPDVGQEEQDMDLQHAARWAMENELIPDLNDEGTAPEEMKFFPANPVSKLDVLNAWQKAQELKNN